MSYILDALKKAEAERDPDTRARLAFEAREQRRNRLIVYAVLAALIANAAILLWLFLPDTASFPPWQNPAPEGAAPVHAAQPPAAAPASAPATTTAPAAASAPATALAPATASPPATRSAATPQAAASVPADDIVIGTRAAPSASTPLTLTNLPETMRQRFPTLNFSTHIYADEPDLRAVVVNGRRLSEGDVLGELTLAEITEDGAVFVFEGRKVEVSVLDAWN